MDGIRLISVWFADDSLLLANSIEAARTNIKIVKKVARGLGLEVNEAKSKVLIIKGRKEVREIEGIVVVERVKFLGVQMEGRGRSIFECEKKEIVKKAEVRACGVSRVIQTSYDRVTVGKAW